MLLAAAAGADRGILPLLRAVLGPDELYSLVTIALLGSYANDLVRLCVIMLLIAGSAQEDCVALVTNYQRVPCKLRVR